MQAHRGSGRYTLAMRVYLYDDGLGELSPLTDLRPSFAVRTGALTVLDRLVSLVGKGRLAGLMVPDALAAITTEAHGLSVNRPIDGADPVLMVNGRWVLPDSTIDSLKPGLALVEDASKGIMAACVEPSGVEAVLAGDAGSLETRLVLDRQLLSKPWHVRTLRDEAIRRDLDVLTAQADSAQKEGYCATIDPSATVHSSAVLETEQGHVVIAAGTTVRPFATIIGPAYIGPDSTVAEQTVIRPNTAIGPVCKVAGELTGVILQGYANKGHAGFLGDSWVGEWVNLGAGTVNSNLLNTYGEVLARATPAGSTERTGETFLGAIIGDHVKTAINTRLMTGTIVGTGTMWAASAAVSGCVEPFTWATDAGQHRFRLNKFIETARAMMARRKIEPSEAYLNRLAALHSVSSAGP
jgi:UDP-N-acetylglucosamine diphosphorylase/glucosamine-1-phosphate N-acetyltransferase